MEGVGGGDRLVDEFSEGFPYNPDFLPDGIGHSW